MNESTNHIDALLRQRLLEELPLAQPAPAGWEALEQKLRADGDLQLRSALTGLVSAAPAPVAGWYALERKLDPRSAADTQLANKLQNLQPDPAPGSWALLADRLEEENGKAVDAILGSGLSRPLAGNSTGWALLAARLELIGWRRGCVAAWKITEGALLLSLLLLLVRFGPVPPTDTTPPLAGVANGFPLPLAALQTQVVENQENTDAGEANPATAPAAVPAATERQNRQSDYPIVPILPPTSSLFDHTPGFEALVAGEEVLEELYLPASVAALPILKLNKAMYLPSPALTLPKIDKGEPVYYYVNAFISPFDFNQVVTPATSIGDFDISGDRRFTQGGSFGLLIDVEQGKNGLQIGAIYSRRSYIPTALKWYLQDEYTAFEPIKGYSRFIFENITFPFNYKRTLLTTENWRVSGRIGMSLSVIARSSFKGQEDVVAGFNAFEERSPGLPPNGSRESERPIDFSGRRKLQNPPSGWLEGGSILANSSFYLGGGVVVERLMNPRWSLYVSPTIGRVIYLQEDSGIGPYNDRINVGSLRLGSRYMFGGK